MRKARIVLDTNVFLVSLAPHFRLNWIFQSILKGEFDLVMEKRYGIAKTDTQLDFLLILPNVIQVNPQFKWDLLKDADDILTAT